MSLTTIKDHYTATLVQAIQALGPGNLTDRQRKQLGALRSPGEYRKIVRDTRSVTAWVHDKIKKVASCAEKEEQRI